MQNEQRFLELHNLMVQQEECIEQLISTAGEQIECMRQNNTCQLQQVVARQEEISTNLAYLEEKRMQVQKELEENLELPVETALRDLLVYAGEEAREKLQAAGTSLQKKMYILKETNEFCRTMARQALGFTDFMLKLFQPQENNYASDGKRKQTSNAKSKINKKI
ncbi:MAG: flagellar protein FlgN [Clostridiales bacterium]|nr:flagellar protein FlgN [Clostridiales bacterium]MCF8021766.1 flagellar protein FlgN [Clostridiales bacterium]